MRGRATFLQNKNEMELVGMAKKNTEVAEKKEFAWDTEEVISDIENGKTRMVTRICTLNGKTYISAQNYVWSAKLDDWKRTKNNTMTVEVFKQMQEVFGDWELKAAFAGTMTARVQTKTENKVAKPRAAKKEKEEKPAKGLKAKKEAQGAKSKK